MGYKLWLIIRRNTQNAFGIPGGVLVPALEIKRNVDKDLNARIEYIKSPIFCERLRYVISEAPYEFVEWRHRPGAMPENRFPALIGPYVMGNPEALGMTQSKGLPSKDAEINIIEDSKRIYFNERFVVTKMFSANALTGLVFNQDLPVQWTNALTVKSFPSIKDVEYRGGQYRVLEGGSICWKCYYTAVPFWTGWKDINEFSIGLRKKIILVELM